MLGFVWCTCACLIMLLCYIWLLFLLWLLWELKNEGMNILYCNIRGWSSSNKIQGVIKVVFGRILVQLWQWQWHPLLQQCTWLHRSWDVVHDHFHLPLCRLSSPFPTPSLVLERASKHVLLQIIAWPWWTKKKKLKYFMATQNEASLFLL